MHTKLWKPISPNAHVSSRRAPAWMNRRAAAQTSGRAAFTTKQEVNTRVAMLTASADKAPHYGPEQAGPDCSSTKKPPTTPAGHAYGNSSFSAVPGSI
eukprot:4836295-Prymnesium_polylepis.3